MTLQQFYDYKQNAFDAFCKSVIRYEGLFMLRKLSKQAAKNISIEDLSGHDLRMLSTNDEYKEETVTFWVRDERIQIEDGRLAQALKYLSPQRRNVILLSYVLRYSDVEIARMLRLPPPAVNYRRTSGLKRLREILLILEDKERE